MKRLLHWLIGPSPPTILIFRTAGDPHTARVFDVARGLWTEFIEYSAVHKRTLLARHHAILADSIP